MLYFVFDLLKFTIKVCTPYTILKVPLQVNFSNGNGWGGVNWVNSYRSVENQCGEEYPLPPLLTCALYHLKQTIQQDVLVRSLCRIDLQIDTTSISLFCLLYNMLPLVY